MGKDRPIFVEITRKISEKIKHLSLFLAWMFLLINIIDIVFSVISRYFFSSSLVWTEELARFTLIWAVMFGGVAALSYGEHVSITIVVEKLPKPLSRILNFLRHIIIIAVLLFMTYMGFEYTNNAWGMTTLAMDIPKAVPLMSIPVGMGLMLIQYILILISSIGD
jgi:TRAP-type C4-dicarboxylate transport system permease small subunit